MEIIRLIQGVFQTNTYILKEGNDIIIIDPAGKVSKIEEHLNNKPLSVLLTHGHFDHIKCVDDLYKKYQ
ncbi:MAG: MBL fold metallo-hydrolase, partial [Erysipelotrichaceae bacterium]